MANARIRGGCIDSGFGRFGELLRSLLDVGAGGAAAVSVVGDSEAVLMNS